MYIPDDCVSESPPKTELVDPASVWWRSVADIPCHQNQQGSSVSGAK